MHLVSTKKNPETQPGGGGGERDLRPHSSSMIERKLNLQSEDNQKSPIRTSNPCLSLHYIRDWRRKKLLYGPTRLLKQGRHMSPPALLKTAQNA